MSRDSSILRIGTRGSQLARWQADLVEERLKRLGVRTEIVVIKTTGDQDQVRPFGGDDSRGLFVKEIEAALLAGEIDLAVHSLKDLPTGLPAGLVLSAVLEREDPRDALLSREGFTLATLPPGARIATGSLRRSAQLQALRTDLEIIPIRGNVPTRIEKMRRGDADATLLAVAGLRRLGFAAHISEILDPEQMTPAMGQGTIGIETREGDRPDLLTRLDHPSTRVATEAEREFIRRVGGGCHTPVGVWVRPAGGATWEVIAVLVSPDGRHLMRSRIERSTNPLADARSLGREMRRAAPPEIRRVLATADDA